MATRTDTKKKILGEGDAKEELTFYALIADPTLPKSLFFLGERELGPGVIIADMYDAVQDTVQRNCVVYVNEITYIEVPKKSRKKKAGKLFDQLQEDEQQQKPKQEFKRVQINKQGELLGSEEETRYWFTKGNLDT